MVCTVSDIVSDVITNLSMVPGVSTQIYGTPRIQQLVQDSSILLLDKMWWPDLMDWYSVALDGSTGHITTDLVSSLPNHRVARYQDIEGVYPIDSSRKLRGISARINPFTLTGGSTVFIGPDAQFLLRPFKVFPAAASGSLAVYARASPVIPMSLDDKVYLDRLALAYLAAYMYAEDDGTNPGAIAKFKGLFEVRLVQAMNAWSEQSVPLDSHDRYQSETWQERC